MGRVISITNRLPVQYRQSEHSSLPREYQNQDCWRERGDCRVMHTNVESEMLRQDKPIPALSHQATYSCHGFPGRRPEREAAPRDPGDAGSSLRPYFAFYGLFFAFLMGA